MGREYFCSVSPSLLQEGHRISALGVEGEVLKKSF